MSVLGCRVSGMVYLVGEIDVANAADHEDALSSIVAERGHQPVVVNCSRLTFLDLRALTTMRRVHELGEQLGTRVVWRGFDQFQRRLIALTGFDQRLHLDPRPRVPSHRPSRSGRCA